MSTDPLAWLGAFAAGVSWSTIPDPVRRRAQLTLRDTIGTILGGAATPAGRVATATAAATASSATIASSRGAVLIPGGADGARATPVLAAFAGAVNASALDMDDGHYAGGAIHPASVIVPALLVAAEQLADVGVHRFLTAQVVGYEIGLRAAYLLRPNSDEALYHCTGTAATLGAAAAVTHLRGGDADTIARSISVAWAHAPMATFQLPMVKESIGWSAASALFAADLAAAGFMASTAGIAAQPSCVEATFTPTPFHRDGAMEVPFVASLGDVWEAGNTYFKPYACCRYTHTAIRSLAEITAEHGLTAPEIASIDVFTHRGAIGLRDAAPMSLDHAQYSFPFVLATQLLCGAVGAVELSAGSITDPARLAVAARIRVHHDSALDPLYPSHYATRLVVTAADRRRWERFRLVAPGDPAEPMSEAELAAKFVDLATPRLGDGAASEWADRLTADPASDAGVATLGGLWG